MGHSFDEIVDRDRWPCPRDGIRWRRAGLVRRQAASRTLRPAQASPVPGVRRRPAAAASATRLHAGGGGADGRSAARETTESRRAAGSRCPRSSLAVGVAAGGRTRRRSRVADAAISRCAMGRLANAASSLSKKSPSDSDAADASVSGGRRRRHGAAPGDATGSGPARVGDGRSRERCSSSFTRPMTSCGSNGFVSTPSHPASSALSWSTGSNAPVSRSTGMCDRCGECLT